MEAPIVEISDGKVRGSVEQTVPETKPVFYYRDIPFAKTERFQKPTDYGSWGDEVWDGTKPTRHVEQDNAFAGPELEPYMGLFPMQQETIQEAIENEKNVSDSSLHLSVMTSDTSGSKAVMVWIHGGGWQSGTVNEYYPTPLVAMGDVVVVSISYRLGAGGFLFGNWGLFDMVKGLEWVQKNVAAFGGDPGNVTIFGESAGGWAVDSLMYSRKASGLFHKGIAQSGSLRSVFPFQKLEDNPLYPNLMKEYSVDSMEALKEKLTAISTSDLVEVGKKLSKDMVDFVHNVDGDFFTEFPDRQSNLANRVPYMIGTCGTEQSWLLPLVMKIPQSMPEEAVVDKVIKGPLVQFFGEDKAAEIAKQSYQGMVAVYGGSAPFEKTDDRFPMYCWFRAMGDQWFHGAFVRAAEIEKEQDVYCYNLCVQTQAHHNTEYANGKEVVKADWVTSDHGDDLMYVFGYPFNGRKLSEGRRFSPEEVELSRRIVKAWTDFANNGNPGWSSFNSKDKIIKEFNATDSLKSGNDDFWAARTSYVEAVLKSMHAK